jgi:sugar lactone lactonase YvrE
MKRGRRLAVFGAMMVASSAAMAGPGEIAIPGDHVFPESIASSRNGTVYVGSIGMGAIFRAKPGAAAAELFVAPNANLRSVTGVLADDKSGTLYACTNDWGMFGITTPGGKGPPTVMAYDLKSGKEKGSYPFPGNAGFCNDIAVGRDGAAYVTDSVIPRVLRLKPGAKALEVWIENPIFGTKGINLDGIAFGPDRNLYVTGFGANKLYRVTVGKGMKAGAVTELTGSAPVLTPDGMRPLAGAKGTQFLLAEGGHLDRVTIDGSKFTVRVLNGDLAGIVAVTQIGRTAWALLGQLNYIFDPKLKGQTPQPFRAVAVSLK